MSSMAVDRRRQWIALGVIAVVLLGLVGAIVLARPGSDADVALPAQSAEPAAVTPDEPQVVMLVARQAPQDEFTPSMGRGQAIEALAAESPTGLVDVIGDSVGLYGGTLELGSCDRAGLVEYLQDHPAKAEAWAGVRSIPVDRIREHVLGLTPLVLRADTLVTNHGFVDGTATPFASVLQSGTAVLVDDRGVPAVRCHCGNPLIAAPTLAPGSSYSGKAWRDWSPNRIVRVLPSDIVIDNFSAVDADTDLLFTRPVGTDGMRDADTGEPAPLGVPGVVVEPGPLSPVPGGPPASSAPAPSAPAPSAPAASAAPVEDSTDATATARPAGEPQDLFRVDSLAGVSSGPTEPTVFTLDAPAYVTYVMTYHYLNEGAGPGTIAFEAQDGTVFGPWTAVGSEGQGGVPNAYWTVEPNEVIPAGTYTVIDSDPSTWSWAFDTDKRGITVIQGIPLEGG